MQYKSNADGSQRVCLSDEYNWIFNTKTGRFARWGATVNDDPGRAPGPEILDVEISTICTQGCEFCYKGNTTPGRNMSLETFKKVIAPFEGNLTQVALGIGDLRYLDISGWLKLVNPDFYNIVEYCRSKGIIPNVTINGSNMLTIDYIKFNKLFGAVAVSHYNDDICFDCVDELTHFGCNKQVNIHKLLCEETYDECVRLIDSVKTDPRLDQLNALVFLTLKKAGRGRGFTPLDPVKYKKLIHKLIKSKIRFGFDSCGCHNFVNALDKDHLEYDNMVKCSEPCEASLFSYYINVDGKGYPCSFCESWGINGIDVTKGLKYVWEDCSATDSFRNLLNMSKRDCPLYNLTYKKVEK